MSSSGRMEPGLLPARARDRIRARLEQAGCPDPAFDSAYLVRSVTGREPRFDPVPLTQTQAALLEQYTQKREQRYPLQYIEGHWGFLGFELAVGPGVLIPRSDTETVAEKAAACLAGRQVPVVLDLCAGSGCLGLGVRFFCPTAKVTCLEKSPAAFRYLKQNCADRAETVLADLRGYQDTLAPDSLDLLVSNPPYLTAQEMDELVPEVRFEPAMALEAGPDGLDFYRYISKYYRRAVKPGGWLVLEIGWQQSAAVQELLAGDGWEKPRTEQDYAGNDRTVLAQKPMLPKYN